MASRTDRGRAGIIGFENGIHGIVTPGGWQYLQIVGTEGWIDVRNEYREFEMWRRWPIDETREMTSAYNHPLVVPPARVQFPNPRVPQSSQTASIDTLVENHEQGTPCNCPGEWALECMEMEIGLRESAAQNGAKLRIRLQDRSLALRSPDPQGYIKEMDERLKQF